MKKILRTLIGHGHNFATRCWALTVLGVWWFDRLSQKNAELGSALAGLNEALFYLGIVCIAVILAAGTGRTFYPNDVKKIFDPKREKERIRQLSKMYIYIFVSIFIVVHWRYFFMGVVKELLYLGLVWIAVMLPIEAERSIRFRLIGNAYGKDPERLERAWKKMMLVWHIVLMSALAAGTYWQYTIVFK